MLRGCESRFTSFIHELITEQNTGDSHSDALLPLTDWAWHLSKIQSWTFPASVRKPAKSTFMIFWEDILVKTSDPFKHNPLSCGEPHWSLVYSDASWWFLPCPFCHVSFYVANLLKHQNLQTQSWRHGCRSVAPRAKRSLSLGDSPWHENIRSCDLWVFDTPNLLEWTSFKSISLLLDITSSTLPCSLFGCNLGEAHGDNNSVFLTKRPLDKSSALDHPGGSSPQKGHRAWLLTKWAFWASLRNTIWANNKKERCIDTHM